MHWWQMAHAKTSVGDTCGAAGVAGGRLDNESRGAGRWGAPPLKNRFIELIGNSLVFIDDFFIGSGNPLNTNEILKDEFR